MDNDLSSVAREVAEFAEAEGLFTCKDIVVGLSGGPDSVMLLTILSELKAKTKDFPDLHAVHVNHNIREEAKEDEELSKRIAKRYNVPIKVVSANVEQEAKTLKRSVEDAGRIVRYKAFRDYIQENDLEDAYIAVAHHADDV